MAIYTKTGDQGQTNLLGGQRISKGNWLVNLIGQIDELNSNLGLASAMMESIRTATIASGQSNSNQPSDIHLKIDMGLASLIGQVRDIQRDLFEIGTSLAQTNQKSTSQTTQKLKSRETQRMAENFVNGNSTADNKSTDNQPSSREQLESKIKSDQSSSLDTNRLEQLIDEMEQDLPRLENFILPGGGVIGAQLMICRSVCRRVERDTVRYFDSQKRRKSKNNQTGQKPITNQALLQYLNRLSDYLFVSSRWINWLMSEDEQVWKR